MRFLLLIFIPYLSFTQIKVNDFVIPDDAMHFYGMVAVGEISHGTQTLLYKERTFAKKLFIDWIVSQFVIFGKEVYDCHKANPTGFGWLTDVPTGQLGTHVRIMVKISYEDFKKVGFVPRKKKDKYYLARDI